MQTADELISEYRLSGTLAALPGGHFINGVFTQSNDQRILDSFDPGRGVAFAQFAAGCSSDVDAAVASAKNTFECVWRKSLAVERGRVLYRAADLIRQRSELLAVVETLDSGKPLQEARGDVAGAARAFEYYAGACDKLQGDTFPLGLNYLGYSVHEPVGVAAQIMPWNFPISTAARGMAPALAAGCTVVAKPAEQTPFTALLLAQILCEAGLPKGACNIVTGLGMDVGAPLTKHPDIDHITFTGSVATGQRVMQTAANNVTRLLLELGGKSPVVVLKDCDQKTALEGVLGAIFENAGQICSAGSRLIVEKAIHEEFVSKLVERAMALRLGHGLDQPDMGPVNSAEHLARIAGFIDRARGRGADVLCGGRITAHFEKDKGWFYLPTIVDNLSSTDELVQEEIFGPVLSVQVAEDADHALALANDCKFGLVAGIYTSDFRLAHYFAREIDAGQVYINEYFAGGIEVPFGGNKNSGFGREKGLEGLHSYTKIKSVAARVSV